jgi:large subunit ribosomal protein L10
MLSKDQKRKFVDDGITAVKASKVIGVVPLAGIPDRLFQKSRNGMRSSVRFITGRKSLLSKILEGDAKTKELASELTGTSAIMLSNGNPFEIYSWFKGGSIKLAAKPKQAAPEDIHIEEGETSLQPGQAVTDLKSAGIDVKIDKGKVVISKSKVLVKKGELISLQVAKALHTLDIMPFHAMLTPSVMLSDGIAFRPEMLDINPERTSAEIAQAFGTALSLSLAAGIVNAYTVGSLLTKAYRSAIMLGIEAKAYDSGIVEMLLGDAAMHAAALNGAAGVNQ